MLYPLHVTQDDLNRLFEMKKSRGSFDVALIEAFVAGSSDNRAKLAYMYPWLVDGYCPSYHNEFLVTRQFKFGNLFRMTYIVRISEDDEIKSWLENMTEVILSLDEFISGKPESINITHIESF